MVDVVSSTEELGHDAGCECEIGPLEDTELGIGAELGGTELGATEPGTLREELGGELGEAELGAAELGMIEPMELGATGPAELMELGWEPGVLSLQYSGSLQVDCETGVLEMELGTELGADEI
jgi:hypothetical protein